MISVLNSLLNSWYQLLNGNVNVPVYRVDAPASATDYVIIRVESESDASNNSRDVTNPVIITEVVTRFDPSELINDSAAHDIDGMIAGLLFPTVGKHNLQAQSGIQITSVRRTDATILSEDDGSYRYYRVITRNLHRILQR